MDEIREKNFPHLMDNPGLHGRITKILSFYERLQSSFGVKKIAVKIRNSDPSSLSEELTRLLMDFDRKNGLLLPIQFPDAEVPVVYGDRRKQ